MKAVRSWTDFPNSVRNACVAIGNFDGVHLGHRHVLDQTRTKAKELGVPHGILTFEPHPREFFAPSAAPFRLEAANTKRQRLAGCGLESLFELPFDADLAKTSAKDFAQKVLCDGFAFSHIFVGANYRFGRNREGSVSDLIDFGEKLGFGVTISELLTRSDGTISSTRIRECLSEGRLGDVADLLGRRYSIQGNVHHNDRKSRRLGMTVATISQTGLHRPKSGVYAAYADVLEGPHKGRYQTTAAISSESLADVNKVQCKAHFHDLFDDIHGTPISVELIEYLHKVPSSGLAKTASNEIFHSKVPRRLKQFAYPCMAG
ncbi:MULTISPECIES: bifunctional riboflavin kinase/FMN adenylyltransferase [Pacificibacter]|uniref:bifunctional riboflavin kinase/FMN adenylyltransferase n=1 Tax=Pacificibacter TaxID=1042323 RepID=UPI001C0A4511|nr:MULTISPECIES: riboflavin kinase [Pacificibacter]MBU2936239.1 bifunctional riboflavin kinase/FMN adenylyltransferase [Pacificibacter marinus]MDO6617383.1 riboflavin kinase [Pacificibacter sp. 1_MG-2023]